MLWDVNQVEARDDTDPICSDLGELGAEFNGTGAPGLIAQIVRAVLAESRQGRQVCAVEFTMQEAGMLLGRFPRQMTHGHDGQTLR